MNISTQRIIELIALGGELSNSTFASIVADDSATARQKLYLLTKSNIITKHPSDRSENIDPTYTLTKRGRELINDTANQSLIYTSTPSTRQHKILTTDLLSMIYLSDIPLLNMKECINSKSVCWCKTSKERKEESKDIFRNNQSIGIIFLPKQILVLYCIRPRMRFSESAERGILQELKRLIEYDELKHRYKPSDIYGVFHCLDTSTYLDWLMPTRTGGAKEIKQFIKNQLLRGHTIITRKDDDISKLLFRDIINSENHIARINERLTGWLTNNEHTENIYSEGIVDGKPIISNPFADPAIINRLYAELWKCRRENKGKLKLEAKMLTLGFNRELMEAVERRRYPTSKPMVDVLAIDYTQWRKELGLT